MQVFLLHTQNRRLGPVKRAVSRASQTCESGHKLMQWHAGLRIRRNKSVLALYWCTKLTSPTDGLWSVTIRVLAHPWCGNMPGLRAPLHQSVHKACWRLDRVLKKGCSLKNQPPKKQWFFSGFRRQKGFFDSLLIWQIARKSACGTICTSCSCRYGQMANRPKTGWGAKREPCPWRIGRSVRCVACKSRSRSWIPAGQQIFNCSIP